MREKNENVSRAILNKLNEAWEPSNLELDENGLPALDAPYYMRWSEQSEFYYIRSAHPYNDADYSYAETKEPDYTGNWYVYGPDGKQAGVVEGYEKAVELMKELDKNVEPRMMYN